MFADIPDFFLFNFTGVGNISDSERELFIRKDFPNANLSSVFFMGVKCLKVFIHDRSTLSTLYTEKYRDVCN